MAGKVISIEIGYSVTRVCEADYKAKTHRVYGHFTIPTPEGVVNDGVLTVTPEYIESLKKALTESKMKAKQVVFTITSGKIASREACIPFVKENRIGDVVSANASEYFPVDLSQYQLAYNRLGTVEETQGIRQHKLLVMAAPTSLLSGYYDLAKALKLELAALDYAGNSVFQVAKDKCPQGTNLVIKVDERSTLVMVVQNGALAFIRNVAYGIGEAVESVMESRRWGDSDTAQKAMDTMAVNDCTLTMEVAEALEPLTGGICRVADYYVSQNPNTSVEKVYLAGLGADIKGLAAMISRELNLSVEELCSVPGWDLDKNFGTRSCGVYIACVGATAAPLGFKKETGRRKNRKRGIAGGTHIAYALLLVGLIAAGAFAVVPAFTYAKLQKENMELKARSRELESSILVYNEYTEALASYNTALAMYDATENRNEDLVEFLEDLERKMPDGVHVSSFTSTAEGVAINMSVSTKSEAAFAIEQLRSFGCLQPDSVTVGSISEETDGETGDVSVTFSVAALYRETHTSGYLEE